jgi:hypothetical protein
MSKRGSKDGSKGDQSPTEKQTNRDDYCAVLHSLQVELVKLQKHFIRCDDKTTRRCSSTPTSCFSTRRLCTERRARAMSGCGTDGNRRPIDTAWRTPGETLWSWQTLVGLRAKGMVRHHSFQRNIGHEIMIAVDEISSQFHGGRQENEGLQE